MGVGRSWCLFVFNPDTHSYIAIDFGVSHLYGIEIATRPLFDLNKNWWTSLVATSDMSIKKLILMEYLTSYLRILDNRYYNIGTDSKLGMKMNKDLTVNYTMSFKKITSGYNLTSKLLVDKVQGLHILSDDLMVFIAWDYTKYKVSTLIWYRGLVYRVNQVIPIINKYVYSRNSFSYIRCSPSKKGTVVSVLRDITVKALFGATKDDFTNVVIPEFVCSLVGHNIAKYVRATKVIDSSSVFRFDNTLLNGQEWSTHFRDDNYYYDADIVLNMDIYGELTSKRFKDVVDSIHGIKE